MKSYHVLQMGNTLPLPATGSISPYTYSWIDFCLQASFEILLQRLDSYTNTLKNYSREMTLVYSH